MGKSQRLYDPSTEVTVKGTVEKVTEITGKQGWSGIHLTLKTDDHSYDVHVGPSDYVSKNGFTFSVGDHIAVTGSKLTGTDTIIAREITMDGKVLNLRNTAGIPNWSGGQRRSY